METINDYNKLKEAINTHYECLVKIGTSCCGPCKIVQKNIENIEKYHSDIYFINVDADEADDRILEEYKVRGVPVTMFIKDGVIISRVIGLQTESELEDRLN